MTGDPDLSVGGPNDHEPVRHLWPDTSEDAYSPRLFVTEGGGIGIDVGGYVIIKPLRDWHALAAGSRHPAQTLTVRGTAENRKKIAKVIFLRSFNEWDWDDPDFALRRRDAERTADAIVTALAVPSTEQKCPPLDREAIIYECAAIADRYDDCSASFIADKIKELALSSTDKSGAA